MFDQNDFVSCFLFFFYNLFGCKYFVSVIFICEFRPSANLLYSHTIQTFSIRRLPSYCDVFRSLTRNHRAIEIVIFLCVQITPAI